MLDVFYVVGGKVPDPGLRGTDTKVESDLVVWQGSEVSCEAMASDLLAKIFSMAGWTLPEPFPKQLVILPQSESEAKVILRITKSKGTYVSDGSVFKNGVCYLTLISLLSNSLEVDIS